jgi:hypothetical protein
VTLTLSSLARAMMDTRLRDETLWAILGAHKVSRQTTESNAP